MRNDRPMRRDSNEQEDRRAYQPVTRARGHPSGCRRGRPGTVRLMIRHVVVFTWSADADADRRATTGEALRRLREEVGGMTSLVVADDAGLSDGNADTVLIADFPDAEAYYRYAQDPLHLAVIAEHVR